MKHLKSSIENEKIEELSRPSVDKGKSLVWICSSGLKGETESIIIAAQGQSIQITIRGTSQSNELIVTARCAVRQKKTQNILLWVAQHLFS
jgi:hypothetical protein